MKVKSEIIQLVHSVAKTFGESEVTHILDTSQPTSLDAG